MHTDVWNCHLLLSWKGRIFLGLMLLMAFANWSAALIIRSSRTAPPPTPLPWSSMAALPVLLQRRRERHQQLRNGLDHLFLDGRFEELDGSWRGVSGD
jgi:hypothetical protein